MDYYLAGEPGTNQPHLFFTKNQKMTALKEQHQGYLETGGADCTLI